MEWCATSLLKFADVVASLPFAPINGPTERTYRLDASLGNYKQRAGSRPSFTASIQGDKQVVTMKEFQRSTI